MSQGLEAGHLRQWVAGKSDTDKGYLHHLNLPLPAEQIKLESIVQTVLTRASAFLWGTEMVPSAVIPLVGSAIIWGPAAAYLLLTSHVGGRGTQIFIEPNYIN